MSELTKSGHTYNEIVGRKCVFSDNQLLKKLRIGVVEAVSERSRWGGNRIEVLIRAEDTNCISTRSMHQVYVI